MPPIQCSAAGRTSGGARAQSFSQLNEQLAPASEAGVGRWNEAPDREDFIRTSHLARRRGADASDRTGLLDGDQFSEPVEAATRPRTSWSAPAVSPGDPVASPVMTSLMRRRLASSSLRDRRPIQGHSVDQVLLACLALPVCSVDQPWRDTGPERALITSRSSAISSLVAVSGSGSDVESGSTSAD
jgi:hypothetical protein